MFEPSDDLQRLVIHIEQTPGILFRAHSPKSSGTTEATHVSSTGADSKHLDVLQKKPEVAKKLIAHHLTTWNRSNKDNFMSWTNSLLYALQHAIRRQATDIPPSRPEDVKILILDTRLLRGAFMPVLALLEAYDITVRKPRAEMVIDRKWFYGEYLSQGMLDIPEGAMITISLQQLIDHGLYKFHPCFANKAYNANLYTRVEMLRIDGSFRSSRTQLPTTREVELAIALAEGCCANPRFRPVLFACLLSLKLRGRKVEEILEAYSKTLFSKC